MRLRFGQPDEVVSVAGHQQTILVVSNLKNRLVSSVRWEDVAEA
jgi:hypothetical protein